MFKGFTRAELGDTKLEFENQRVINTLVLVGRIDDSHMMRTVPDSFLVYMQIH